MDRFVTRVMLFSCLLCLFQGPRSLSIKFEDAKGRKARLRGSFSSGGNSAVLLQCGTFQSQQHQHIRIFLSSEVDTICLPSGENAIEVTESVCPSSGFNTVSPLSASQTRIVQSSAQATIHSLTLKFETR
jgi:hypothetical protein